MKEQKGKKVLIISLIVILIILVIGVSCIFILKKGSNVEQGGIQQSEKKINTPIEPPEKKLYRINKDKQLYADKEGNILNLEKLINEDTEANLDFTYGTALIGKSSDKIYKYAIIDYKGNIIVDYDKYKTIDVAGLNFIAKTHDGNSVLLDSSGKVIDNIETPSYISNHFDDGIYVVSKSDKKEIMTNAGDFLFETENEISMRDMKIWKDKRNFIAILYNDTMYIIDKETYKKRHVIKSKNIGVGIEYITDIENGVTYIYDKQSNMKVQLEDCLIEDDETWNNYKAIYTGARIDNDLDNSGYVCYVDKNNKLKIVYKNGTALGEYDIEEATIYTSKYTYGEDYIFIENGDNIDVYNKDKKVNTIGNKTLNANLTSPETLCNRKAIALAEVDGSNVNIYLYNSNGERLNDVVYKYGRSSILKTENANVKLLANGELMDAKDYSEIMQIPNENKENEYSSNYFIGKISIPGPNSAVNKSIDTYYLIDKAGNKIVQVKQDYFSQKQLYEDDGIFIYGTEEGTFSVYDLNERKEILKSESNLNYVKDYKIIETTKTEKDIYSLTEKKIYAYEK